MLRFVALVFVAVLAGCSGGDGTDSSAAVAPAQSTETSAAEITPLPPLSSVPFETYGTNHIEPPASFATSPSTGGDHYAFWQNCGYYTVPVIEGAATHTLEHGAVWITYNQSAMSADDLSALEALAAGNPKLLISPYTHDDAVVLSAWGVQQRGVSAPSTTEGSTQISEFVAAWADSPTLAEAGVTCGSAVGVPPDDVRSFPDGQQVPAEFS